MKVLSFDNNIESKVKVKAFICETQCPLDFIGYTAINEEILLCFALESVQNFTSNFSSFTFHHPITWKNSTEFNKKLF